MATNHNKSDQYNLLVIIVRGTSAAPCHNIADETVGRRKQVDWTVAVGDQCRLHSQCLQHLHLSIKIHSWLPVWHGHHYVHSNTVYCKGQKLKATETREPKTTHSHMIPLQQHLSDIRCLALYILVYPWQANHTATQRAHKRLLNV